MPDAVGPASARPVQDGSTGRDGHRGLPFRSEIGAQNDESQRVPPKTRHKPLRLLDIAAAGADNPADPVGFCRAASEEESDTMAEPTRVDAVSRRTVLKGLAGAAGLVSIPAIIAACSSSGSSTAPSAAAPSAAASAAAPSAAASAAASAATGSVTFGSNYSNK